MTTSSVDTFAETVNTPIHALSYSLGGWVDLTHDIQGIDSGEIEKKVEIRERISGELGRIVGAENLVILSGLGTSLGIPPSIAGLTAPRMADLWELVVQLAGFSEVKGGFSSKVLEEGNLEHLLSEAQMRLSLDPGNEPLEKFVSDSESIVLEQCSFINDESNVEVHQMFLRKVARRSTRLQRTQLFTTNYDLAFEMAARKANFHLIDGFGLGGRGDFDGNSFDLDLVRRHQGEQLTFEPNVVHFMKLHGSVDWDESTGSVRRISGTPTVPVLIYPSEQKFQLSYQQPYLEIMARFQMALRQPDVGLVVVGFGFNDAHLVAPIVSAIRSNSGLRLTVIDPSIRAERRNSNFEWLENLTLKGDRRLTLIDSTFAGLTSLLPDVPPKDERDAHMARTTGSSSERAR